MADLIIRNLEDDVRTKLEQSAESHGRSVEEEVREILRTAVLKAEAATDDGIGTRIAKRFQRFGIEPGEIAEQKGQLARPAQFLTCDP